MNNTRSVRSNMIYNSVFQFLIYIIPLITTPYVSRVLGADSIGQYSYALSNATYFTLLASLGSGTHGQRLIAYNRDNSKSLSESFWNILSFRIISTIICVTLYYFYLFKFEGETLLGQIVVLNIINVAFDITWFFQGIEDFRLTVFRGLLVKIIGLISIFLFVKTKDDTWKYAIILLGSTIIGNLSLWFRLPSFITHPHNVKPFKELNKMFYVFLPTVATQVYLVLDKSMIGWITKSDYNNGCYDQSEKIIRVVLIVITSVSTVLLPRVANLYSHGKLDNAKEYVYKAYRAVFFLAIPLFFGSIVCSSILIPVYLGPGFDLSIPLMQIFSWLLIVVSMASITGLAYLVPTQQQNIYTISVSVAAIANFIINLILIPKIGAYGAAIASIVAETIGTTIQIWYCVYKKQLEFKRIIKPSWKYWVAGSAMFGIIKWLQLNLDSNLKSLLLIIVTGVLVYFVSLVVLRDSLLLNQIKRVSTKHVR